ncbi:MAG: trehalose-phosphatase [Myroides sp.]|nr:trehalose-phosphatase [Myroides sp.]
MISNNHFEILPQSLNKGNAVKKFIRFNNEAFILAAGDDDTDEDLFSVLPKSAFTFKIGRKATKAKVRIAEIERFIGLLSDLADDKVRY